MSGLEPVELKKGGFPDLSGDGKVTQKDILIGRGVIKKANGGGVGEAINGLKKDLKGQPRLIDKCIIKKVSN